MLAEISPGAGTLVVRGTTADNGIVKRVVVNGREAHSLAANFAEWEVVLENAGSGEVKLAGHAEDLAGNKEKMPHIQRVGQ